MILSTPDKNVQNRYILFFLLGWTLLNVLQACTLGVHSDEAYYWVYSRFLDWGYFDHPPMVAVFIRIGDTIVHNEFGLRLMTISSSTISMYVLWLIARKYLVNAWWFIVVITGTLIFHIYGFSTTPDAPLLLFTILFYYFYQQYLSKDSWGLAAVLGLVVACLLYSKYHGLLLVIFTLAAHIGIFKRRTFWLIPIIALTLFAPHLLWQINHGYPSVNYHLFERSSETYEFAHTYLYFPGQLLMAGPLVGWFWFYYGLGRRSTDLFTRCLLVNSAGIYIFFLLNTAKGNVQPHWTLIGFVPLVLLVLIRLQQDTYPKWLFKMAVVNAALIITFRLLLAAGLPVLKNINALKSYYHFDEWSRQIKQKAGNHHIIIEGGFQLPSKYNFYTNSLKGFAYDDVFYRRTQYDIWPIEDSLQHQKSYYLSPYPMALKADTLHTVDGIWYGAWVNDVRTFQKIDIRTDNYKVKASPQQPLNLKLQLLNPGNSAANFATTTEQPVELRACFYKNDSLLHVITAQPDFNKITIPAHQQVNYTLKGQGPIAKGRYMLIFSIRTKPFPGGRNSRIVNFTVQ
jgi:hypothetical protein